MHMCQPTKAEPMSLAEWEEIIERDQKAFVNSG
jgi:hypothetical protein